MYAIRGAITVENNSIEDINQAVKELIEEIIKQNALNIKDISYVLFTMTKDLDAVYPAKSARDNFDFKYVPMMCVQELYIKNSLEKCIRVLITVNGEKEQNLVKHIYLKNAQKLRPDLV